MTRLRKGWLFVPTLAVGLLTLARASYGGAAYHGSVVDSETKAPLQGAVVVVVWHRKPIVTMDGPQYFHKAVEALTDAEGKFSVDASPGIDWNPFTYVLKEPRIAIFKPGYGPFPVAHVSPRSVKDLKEALLGEGALVELPRLKTKEELLKFTSPGNLWISVDRDERIPHLMRLINIQRRSLGLQPYPGAFERG